jgi:hypothetical protein
MRIIVVAGPGVILIKTPYYIDHKTYLKTVFFCVFFSLRKLVVGKNVQSTTFGYYSCLDSAALILVTLSPILEWSTSQQSRCVPSWTTRTTLGI